MLKTMRQHAKYFYVLFGIIILSFIFWGVGPLDRDEANIVAEVGSYKIRAEEYWKAYDRIFRFYRDQDKEKFDEEKKLKLKENVLDSLIDNRVLLITAEKTGITVSDDELNEAITHESVFMENGVFDSEIYHNRLRLSRYTPELYESIRRQDLLLTKMRRLIELSANIPLEGLDNFSGDEQTLKIIKEAIINDAKAKAVKAYVVGLKKGIKIKVYRELIS